MRPEVKMEVGIEMGQAVVMRRTEVGIRLWIRTELRTEVGIGK